MSYLEIVDAHKHNLKHLYLKLPKRQIIVISGVSGSGKSTLAYDTIFQEGQRKYLESLSAYARQFIKSLERPDVQAIKGIAPTISIDQKHASFYYNSTVGTVSEVAPYLRLLFARLGEARCPTCGEAIRRHTPEKIQESVFDRFRGQLARVYSPVVRQRRGSYQALFERYRRRGFLKVLVDGRELYLDEAPALERHGRHDIAVQVDAVEVEASSRAQLAEGVRLALAEGDGEVLVRAGAEQVLFSDRLHCARCGVFLPEPHPGTFSLNSPEGACPECLGGGVVGEAGSCPACGGRGFRFESLAFHFRGRNIFELGEMEIVDLLSFFRRVRPGQDEADILRTLLPQLIQRLESFALLNLGYLTLNRRIQTVSGGELQRARLVSQLGFALNGIVYVLDEPSIGMHISEQLNLLAILRRLCRKGNTLVVVEHDEETIRAADHIVDIGPGAGERGGEVVYSGPSSRFESARQSLTSDYVYGRRRIDPFQDHPPAAAGRRAGKGRPAGVVTAPDRWLEVRGIRLNNLSGVDLRLPLQRLTVVSGVSGSGKSSLVVDALAPALRKELEGVLPRNPRLSWGAVGGLEGVRHVRMVNQSAIGKNSRSCPATYVGVMAMVRDLFAALPASRVRGYSQSRFSFNVRGGRCEACAGLGVQRLQMSFLPQLEVTCPVCEGERYNSETRQVKYKGHSIAEVLDLTASEAYGLFAAVPALARKIRILIEVGLGYLRLGQSSQTLSGGESQRIKLTKELARPAGSPAVYVLDEPTIGLHFDDVRKLIDVLRALIARGHTVVVIEHNLEVLRLADHVIDLGPGGGRHGGRIVYQGDIAGLVKCRASLTGKYLKKKLAYGVRRTADGNGNERTKGNSKGSVEGTGVRRTAHGGRQTADGNGNELTKGNSKGSVEGTGGRQTAHGGRQRQ
ncbi:MAG: excinuclease ABC subunit UvrA [Candidatus Aminicenantes bacterium]|nr:excinuclease ABC subunit UvrA [Candidatus Aminicenantes bacterium]